MSSRSNAGIIAVAGAGTMGAGIAQVAATNGHDVVLLDVSEDALERAEASLGRILVRLEEKGRISADERSAILRRITFSTSQDAAVDAGFAVEAVVEDLETKRVLLASLDRLLGDDAVLATNTSSLSVTAIAEACADPRRVVGMHFFNPAPLMPLVEIVPGLQTSATSVENARTLAESWGKVAVVARDTPGFIVNRIARPFYGEALRILDEGIADAPTIDWAMKEIGGFRMGPFELMDLIGNDVNFTVTRTVYEATFQHPRYRPSITQQRMVEAGRLGRKSGVGYYIYGDGASNTPENTPGNTPPTRDENLGAAIVDRIVAMLMNEAADAVFWNVATARDIDLAMTKGVNYPRGLLEWIDDAGASWVVGHLRALRDRYGEERYNPSPILLDQMASGEKFHG